MHIVHVLRKYNPSEWGGTETALQRLFDGLRPSGVTSIVYCPRHTGDGARDPLAEAGYQINRYRACVPIWGISQQTKRQMIAVGGNLMSFDLIPALRRESNVSLIHTHTTGRIGGIAYTVARKRRVPCVVTIHGGVLDLPAALQNQPGVGGMEWGKIFGLLYRSRQLLAEADAIITCNQREASLLGKKYPGKRIQVQPHGVPMALFEKDQRRAAFEAYPQIRDRQILLVVGRIDAVKNQSWVVERMEAILLKHPQALLVLAGACTNESYGTALGKTIRELGLENHVLLTGGLPPGDPRLIGLMQNAAVVLLPSISETFGLVILEAWAAGAAVISSRTSGGSALIQHRQNGWLFDLESPQTFHKALDQALLDASFRQQLAAAGHQLARCDYDIQVLARRVKNLYEELIQEKHAIRHPARR